MVNENDEFPLYVVVDPKLESQFGLEGGIMKIHPPGMDPVMAIFTDEDLARRFCEDLRRPDAIAQPIYRLEDMLRIAEFFRNNGVDNVARDISFHPPTIQTTSMAIFIDSIRREPKKQ